MKQCRQMRKGADESIQGQSQRIEKNQSHYSPRDNLLDYNIDLAVASIILPVLVDCAARGRCPGQ